MQFSSKAGRIFGFCATTATVLLLLATSAPAMEHELGFANTGVVYYPGYDWGWGWGGPFWGAYGWPYYWDDRGTVKLENAAGSDEVYVNGSYAGKAKKLRSIYLDPGNYTIAVKDNGKNILDRKVYVVTGKTVKLEVGDKGGTVKLKDAAKIDKVYVNGIYKGLARDLKSFELSPGIYNIRITNNGRRVLDQQVNVRTDGTVRLNVGDRG